MNSPLNINLSSKSRHHPAYTDSPVSMDYLSPHYSSSPRSSSPMPQTPLTYPVYTRVQASPDIGRNKTVHRYPEDYDDISARSGTSHQRYIAPIKSLYSSSGMSVHTSFTSHYDASYTSEDPNYLSRSVSLIESDVRQTCFAISSERGRWKSSPIPIKTYSRPSARVSSSSTSRPNPCEKTSKAMSNISPLKLTGMTSGPRAQHVHSSPTEWRRPSTASSISDFPCSPVSLGLPSKSEEPLLHRAASSSLPSSSPPMSPISIAPWMDMDDELEIDMLDSDDDFPKIDNPTVHLQPESGRTESRKKGESLIPAIATLDLSILMSTQVDSRVAEEESRQTSTSPIPIPSALGMPTPEATPAPQDTLPALKPISSESRMSIPSPTKEQSPVPEPPSVNMKNEPHSDQFTIPAEQTSSTHIPASIHTPTGMNVDIHNVSEQPELPSVSENDATDLVVHPAPPTGVADSSTPVKADRILSPDVHDSPLTPLPELEPFIDVNDTRSEISRPSSTLSSDVLPSRPDTDNEAQHIAVENATASRSTQGGDVNAAPKTDAIVGSQIKAKTTTKDKSNKAVPHVKGSKKSEKIGERSANKEKKVVKHGQPSKPTITCSSKPRDVSHHPVTVSVTPEKGKHKADPVKRKAKAEDRSEGPAKKKAKVSKYESDVALRTDDARADSKTEGATTGVEKTKPSSPKPKAKPTPSLHSDESGPSLFDHTSIQLEELQGLLIEAFAVSRASSQSASALYRGMSQSRPSLKNDHSDKEWLQILESALETARSQSGMFEKVESSFKDDSARALEAKWFYVPERDPDQERATIIRNMMPRAGKRSETKKYKQYYYQPLDKISRWDPEDDL